MTSWSILQNSVDTRHIMLTGRSFYIYGYMFMYAAVSINNIIDNLMKYLTV